MPKPLVRYRSVIADNARWEGFAFRDGDIIISTPPKCGTTWTQMICALLIFQTADLPRPVDQISPWLEQSLRKPEDVVRDLEAQEHRRFIKSHTPMDGLPLDDRVTYICVGRDPRDAALSWDNHMNNLDLAALFAQRERAVGLEDLAELMPDEVPVPPPTEIERFWRWVDESPDLSQSVGGLAATLHHLETFWRERERPNVIMLHYAELEDDLEGQMRGLASLLGIDVPNGLWPDLVRAATFDEMRSRAEERAPNATDPIWVDTGRFFNKGHSGQWRRLLDASDLERYARRVGELVDDDLSHWVHRGRIL